MYKGYKPKRLKAKYKPRRNVPKLVARVKRLEKKTSGIELKYRDTESGAQIPAVAGAFFLLNGIAQGDDHDDRNGDSVTMSSIQLRLLATGFPANDKNQLRVMIVQDKQPNEAIFTIADLLSRVATLENIGSYLNLNNVHRFRIISNTYITIDDDGQSSCVHSIYKKLNFKTRYSGAAGNIADINTNSLYAFVIGANALGDFHFTARLRYLDS